MTRVKNRSQNTEVREIFLTLFTVGGGQGDSYDHPWLREEESSDFSGLTQRWLKFGDQSFHVRDRE